MSALQTDLSATLFAEYAANECGMVPRQLCRLSIALLTAAGFAN